MDWSSSPTTNGAPVLPTSWRSQSYWMPYVSWNS
jgi:hypothetical protein